MVLATQIYVCRSGSAADTQNMASYVQLFLAQHGMELGRDPDVKTAAKLASTLCYQNKVSLLNVSHSFTLSLFFFVLPLPSLWALSENIGEARQDRG
jgi:20S proteasome alpha/beta subunit